MMKTNLSREHPINLKKDETFVNIVLSMESHRWTQPKQVSIKELKDQLSLSYDLPKSVFNIKVYFIHFLSHSMGIPCRSQNVRNESPFRYYCMLLMSHISSSDQIHNAKGLAINLCVTMSKEIDFRPPIESLNTFLGIILIFPC